MQHITQACMSSKAIQLQQFQRGIELTSHVGAPPSVTLFA